MAIKATCKASKVCQKVCTLERLEERLHQRGKGRRKVRRTQSSSGCSESVWRNQHGIALLSEARKNDFKIKDKKRGTKDDDVRKMMSK